MKVFHRFMVALLPVLGGLAVAHVGAPAQAAAPPRATVVDNPPPPGFDPLTASAADLQRYGFPHRPADSAHLPTWTEAMSHATRYVPAVWLDAPGIHFGGYMRSESSEIWAGYTARQTDNGNTGFNYAEAYFTMPSAGPSSIAEELAPWVGTGGDINLSGGASNYILQGGVTAQTTSWYQQHGSAPQTNYYLWTENYPDPPATSTSLPLTPGHSMYVSMDWSYNAAKYTVFWEDVTTGQYTSWTRSVSQPGTSTDNPGTSGDCIAEEQGTHYQFPDPQFNYCYLEQGAPGVTGIGNYLDDEFYTEYDMMVGTVSYALPYIVNPHSGSFRMTVYPG